MSNTINKLDLIGIREYAIQNKTQTKENVAAILCIKNKIIKVWEKNHMRITFLILEKRRPNYNMQLK